MGDNLRNSRSFEHSDDIRPRNINSGTAARFPYDAEAERPYSAQWPPRQGTDQQWHTREPLYTSESWYGDSRDTWSQPNWPEPGVRERTESSIYMRVSPADLPYHASERRTASWDSRVPARSPPRRTWTDLRDTHSVDRYREDVGPDYSPRAPYDPAYPRDPRRDDYPAVSDLRRSLGSIERYDDRARPPYRPAPDPLIYRSVFRHNDAWDRPGPVAPAISNSSARASRSVMDPPSHPPRRAASYERPPDLFQGKYPTPVPTKLAHPARPRASNERPISISSDNPDGHARSTVPVSATRPVTPPGAGTQPERLDEFGRVIPWSRTSSQVPISPPPLIDKSFHSGDELDEFGRVRRRHSLDLAPIKEAPSHIPPVASHQSSPPNQIAHITQNPEPDHKPQISGPSSPSSSRPSRVSSGTGSHAKSSDQNPPNAHSPLPHIPPTPSPKPYHSSIPQNPKKTGSPPVAPAPSSSLGPDRSRLIAEPREADPLPFLMQGPSLLIKVAPSPSLPHVDLGISKAAVQGSRATFHARAPTGAPVDPEAWKRSFGTSDTGYGIARQAFASDTMPQSSQDVHYGQFQATSGVKLSDVMPSLGRSNGNIGYTIRSVTPNGSQSTTIPLSDAHNVISVLRRQSDDQKSLNEHTVSTVLSQNQRLNAGGNDRIVDSAYMEGILADQVVVTSIPSSQVAVQRMLEIISSESDMIDTILNDNLRVAALNVLARQDAHAATEITEMDPGCTPDILVGEVYSSTEEKDVDEASYRLLVPVGNNNSIGVLPSAEHTLHSSGTESGLPLAKAELTSVDTALQQPDPSLPSEVSTQAQSTLLAYLVNHPDAIDTAFKSLSRTNHSAQMSDDDAENLLKEIWSIRDLPDTRGKIQGDLAELFDGPSERQEAENNCQVLQPFIFAHMSEQSGELERKNYMLLEEYKAYTQSWEMHRQRLERLEAFRARKTGLLAGDDGRTSGRRGAISLGDAARSDLELDQIMASLVNEDLTNPEILSRKNLAVIPDMISVTDPSQLEIQIDDQNGLVIDPEAFTLRMHDAGVWTPQEEQIFLDAYIATPKQFGRIAEQIRYKSPEQCVLHYYLNKKLLNIKGLLSKQGPRRGRRGGRRGKQKGNALLNDLRDGGADEDDSALDSSPGPEQAQASDTDGAPAQRLRRKPRNHRTTDSDEDFPSDDAGTGLSENDRGSATPLIFVDESDNLARKKAKLNHMIPNEPISTGRGRGRGRGRGNSTTYWSPPEKAAFMRLLPIHGKNWAAISEQLQEKTPLQVRNYFQNHTVELGLGTIAARAEKLARASGVPLKPLLKAGSNAPGIASPLSQVVALSDEPLEPSVLRQQMQPMEPRPEPLINAAADSLGPLPSIHEFLRNVQDQLNSDDFRAQHQIPTTVPKAFSAPNVTPNQPSR